MSGTSIPSPAPELPSPFDIPGLLEDITSNGKALAGGDASARKKLLTAARTLGFALESPVEAILRIAWSEPALNVATRIAMDLDVFSKLLEDGSSPKSSSQLAAMTGADPALMGRILKHLTAMGVLHEVDADSYGTTPLATALAVPKYPDGFPFCIDTAWPPFTKLHEYLAKTGYKNPANPMDGPFQYGHNTPLHFFGWMTEHPKVLDTFNNHMTVYRQGRPSWMDPDFYPVEDLLAKGMNTDKDAVLLVDIGGGLGHDIEEFQRKLPQLPGRLILQDQAQVIKETSNVHKSIEPMVTDFFTPQPIKGARAYYMHSVLHDWPDDRCRDILLNIIPSMTKGYSKILINENVIPDKDAHWMSTALDWFMMVFFSSCERTEKSWRELLTSVGLKVVKIWTYEPGTESLIEAELV